MLLLCKSNFSSGTISETYASTALGGRFGNIAWHFGQRLDCCNFWGFKASNEDDGWELAILGIEAASEKHEELKFKKHDRQLKLQTLTAF